MTWVELFFDLVFVAAVSQIGTPLARHYAFAELGRYAFLLLVVWWAWHGYAVYATRFDGDDGVERAATLAQMLAVVFMAANAEQGLESESSAGFAAAYAVMRLILVGRYVRAMRRRRGGEVARDHAVGIGLAATLWLLSSVLPASWRCGIWAAALAVDLGTAAVAGRHTLQSPPDAAHLPERFGLFTLILLGEAIVAVMRGIQGQPAWSAAAAGTALSGVALVCAAWWGYFDWAAAAAHRPVRSVADRLALDAWSAAHLPLYLGVALLGVGVEHAVTAGGWQALHGEEAGLVAAAAALTLAALAALAATRAPARTTLGAAVPVTASART